MQIFLGEINGKLQVLTVNAAISSDFTQPDAEHNLPIPNRYLFWLEYTHAARTIYQ